MAVFMVPGVGVQSGAARLAMFAPRLATWLGVGTSAVMEASVEAGTVYTETMKREANPEKANDAANKVFWTNLPVLLITDKLGIFGDKGGSIRRAFSSALMEGSQEASQELIANLALGDPALKGVLDSFGVGAIVGGGIGGVHAVAEGKPAIDAPVSPEADAALATLEEPGIQPIEEIVPKPSRLRRKKAAPLPGEAPAGPQMTAPPPGMFPDATVSESSDSDTPRPKVVKPGEGVMLKPRYGVEGDESVESGGQWGDVVKGSAKAEFKKDSLKMLKARACKPQVAIYMSMAFLKRKWQKPSKKALNPM